MQLYWQWSLNTDSRIEHGYEYFLFKQKTTSIKWCWVLDHFNKNEIWCVIYTSEFSTTAFATDVHYHVFVSQGKNYESFFHRRKCVHENIRWKFVRGLSFSRRNCMSLDLSSALSVVMPGLLVNSSLFCSSLYTKYWNKMH